MELQGEDGSIIELSETLQKELGRGPGIFPHDRTVSRRQVRLQPSRNYSRLRVSVEVIGPNPICLIHSNAGEEEVEIAKPGTHSSLAAGDKLSLSIQDPVFYTLQELATRAGQSGKSSGDDPGVVEPDEEEGIAEAVARWQRRKQERLQLEQKRADKTLTPIPGQVEAERRQVEDIVSGPALVSSQHEADDFGELKIDEVDTDFVEKFGFVVEGSEFEQYGKKAHDTSIWEWQIGPRPANDSDEEDGEERTGKRSRNTSGSKAHQTKTKRATNADDDDDDWRGDSEGEQKLLSTGKRRKKEVQTRSHDLPTSSSKQRKKPKSVSTSVHGKTRANSTSTKRKKEEEEEEEEEEEDGEGLDGFLVDDVEEEDEPEAADDEDEWTDEDVDEEEDEIDDKSDDKPLCKYGSNCFRKNKDHLAEFRH